MSAGGWTGGATEVEAVEAVDAVVVGLGGIGSAAAWQLARRGASVVGLEQFELGHARGASHDTSRILRRSYHTPGYVRLAGEAYDDWSDLEHAAGEPLVTRTGGVDLFPPGAAIPADDYATSMTAEGVPFEVLGAADVTARWPAMRVPDGTVALWQEDTSVVPAGRTTRVLQRLASGAGARLRDRSPVVALEAHDDGTVGVRCGGDRPAYRARHVVLAADAWTGDLLAHLGTTLPLTVTREQVTYFRPDDLGPLTPPALPVWIWMDDPSYYGFPVYDEPGSAGLVKAGQDVGGRVTTADGRSFEPDADGEDRLAGFVGSLLPGAGRAERTVTCLYTLTPDRDFVLDRLPKHPAVVVGLGAGHGFKFVPTFGRVLADLVTDGATTSDLSAFAVDRPALVEPDHPTSWLV
ncbi:MAG TPA: N-methyl-L-tryptophan oxidase [Actinomycetes bacterium]|nr:N-methyl-L-tryptophan oxidase [Actinomycetes bacterium]